MKLITWYIGASVEIRSNGNVCMSGTSHARSGVGVDGQVPRSCISFVDEVVEGVPVIDFVHEMHG